MSTESSEDTVYKTDYFVFSTILFIDLWCYYSVQWRIERVCQDEESSFQVTSRVVSYPSTGVSFLGEFTNKIYG